jgi:hypothetical protein
VNKLDKVCLGGGDSDVDSASEEELQEDDVVDKVHTFIVNICGCSPDCVPREVVIPVFGIWAYKAKMLQREPDSMERKRSVAKILCRVGNQPSGQGEDPETSQAERSGTKLARDLLKCSNILLLEKRLQEMTKSCITVWTQKVQADYSDYLQNCKLKLCRLKDKMQDKLNETSLKLPVMPLSSLKYGRILRRHISWICKHLTQGPVGRDRSGCWWITLSWDYFQR